MIILLLLTVARILATSLVFIHIPKNAGTTITKLAKLHGIEWRYREQGSNIRCSSWHIPPSEQILSLNGTSFCVVRNPYERILSRYYYSGSKQEINYYISYKLAQLKKNPYINDCHWIPQNNYTKYCNHVLKFENLVDEFNQLMLMYKIDIKLNLYENKSSRKSKLSIANISLNNLLKIKHYYREDFNKFSY